MRYFREAALALCLIMAPAVVTACDTLGTPASFGCTPEETNECRIVQASLIVKAANVTIGQQLDTTAITVAEARRLRAITSQAEAAIVAARAALPLENGTTLERIEVLRVILLQLLREQVIKRGA